MANFITDDYAVSPQITAAAMPQLAELGFSDVICNRPDAENGPAEQHGPMQEAAEAAGLKFHFLPLVHQSLLEPQNAAAQKSVIEAAKGKVFAYCASGNRSSIVWALGKAGELSADEILEKTRAAGYDLSQLRPMLG